MNKFQRFIRENSQALTAGFLGALVGSGLFALFVVPFIGHGSFSGQNVTVQEDSAIIASVNKTIPAVVSISSSQQIFNPFLGNIKVKQGGTGFILTPDGLIATNKHVIADANANYTVILNSGKTYSGRVVAQDPSNDLALLKISATNLPTVTLGDSGNLQVGQRVIAIGNAVGQYQNTVTSGIISGIGRAISASDFTGGTERLENVIQTDASINPGNSGGPLVNLEGQVIGINTAVDISCQSLGFAIPVSYLRSALTSYQFSGKVVRPLLGVRYVNLNASLAQTYNLSQTQGAYLVPGDNGEPAVAPNGPADLAGLKQGDIITKINNETLTDTRGLVTILQEYKPGDTIDVTIIRNGKEMSFKVTLSQQ